MDKGTTPKRYRAEFIEPGIISYEDIDAGKVLVKRQALNKMLASFVGRPVFNVSHNDTKAQDAFDFSKMTEEEKENLACGIISAVGTLDNGWDYADMMIWDSATQKNIDQNGFTVSCAYIPTSADSGGGKYHGLPYDEEVLDGSYTHMAVVDNPRYEDSKVYANSKQGDSEMKIWFTSKNNAKKNADDDDKKKADEAKKKADEAENAKKNEGDGEESMNASDAYVNVGGSKVPVSELVQAYTKNKKNAEDTSKELGMDDEVEMPDGTRCKVSDLVKSYSASKKNEATDPQDTEAEDVVDEGKQKSNSKREKPNAEFAEMKNAAGKGAAFKPSVIVRGDRLTVGAERYGSAVLQKVKEEV